MHCPRDDSQLVTEIRNGVEIDYCPRCRGVWLDRGEIDKIVERSSDPGVSRPEAHESSGAAARNTRDTPGGLFERLSDAVGDRDNDERRQGKTRKRSFLDDLFDF